MATIYSGNPKCCDICKGPFHNCMVDGRTRMGPWANMCASCYKLHGCGLGTGKGQRYVTMDGRWVKAEG